MLWQLKELKTVLADQLATHLGVSRILSHCLMNRGLCDPVDAQNFLEPRLKTLPDPFHLPNMDRAVDRLIKARTDREPLVIFGDYDVDGVTSTALLVEVMTALGWQVHYYLPHRMTDGYGLSEEAVLKCLEKWPVRLLLAVDCGSSSFAVIKELAHRGVDVVVLDHHKLGDPVPPAVALVNPLLKAGEEPFCSVGLAFKLAHALVKTGRQQGWPEASQCDLRDVLDLVALGTIADLVPLRGQNRILTRAGLEFLNETKRPGLKALKAVAGVKGAMNVRDVAFQLAPRLNAAGRLENALQALELLMARYDDEARELAEILDSQNRERQGIERKIASEVIELLKATFDPQRDYVLVAGNASWHIGVVGIVASRVVREFYRPAIIVGGDQEGWRGSGRSIQGLDLASALRECDSLLLKHGGHAMAAGVSINPANIDAFRAKLNETVRGRLLPEQLEPCLHIDLELSLSDLTIDLTQELARLEPIGQENAQPRFVTRKLRLKGTIQRLGAEQKHAKFFVTDGRETHEAVWWNVPSTLPLNGIFDLVVHPEINTFREPRLQLNVLDAKPAALSQP
jgi:single-stranded-DNA-specific exonuclease